jgi:predicted dehydrogenase
MRPIRCAVFGAGHFGRYHAQKYAATPGAELVAVVDADPARAAALAAETGTRAESSLEAMIGRIDAASVAVPTHAHYDVAARLLDAGIHVLVEKPIAATLDQADALVALAQRRGVVLQVGHLQRFLLQRMEIQARVVRPLFIEALRIAPFKPRGTDVGVVLDLMIHDIDLILALVGEPVTEVDAVGAPVVTASEDLVNARLKFANGCVASVTASRIGFKTERRLRIFQPASYLSVDLAARQLTEVSRRGDRTPMPHDVAGADMSGIARAEHSYPDGDDLAAEIADFVRCVRDGAPPLVSGSDGRRALETAIRVTESLRANLRAAGIPDFSMRS